MLTTELVTRAEAKVGSQLGIELREHLRLADLVTNIVGDEVEEIQRVPGDPRAIHACAILMSRLTTDLRAIMVLVRSGYVAPALSLTAGMLEMAYTSMYIGADEERAETWLSHADPGTTPWNPYNMIHAVVKQLGLDEEKARREYEQIYRQSCMAKHGNPLALGEVGLVARDDSVFVLIGPYEHVAVRRWAHVSVSLAVRYTKLAALKYLNDHLPPASHVQYRERWAEAAELQRRLEAADLAEFGRPSG